MFREMRKQKLQQKLLKSCFAVTFHTSKTAFHTTESEQTSKYCIISTINMVYVI